MEFEVYRVRTEGKLLPRHVMWSTKVRGDLYVGEEYVTELKRAVRVATVKAGQGFACKGLIPPLFDIMLVSAKPDWWTMTGWERIPSDHMVEPRAFQQSWILIPGRQGPVMVRPSSVFRLTTTP